MIPFMSSVFVLLPRNSIATHTQSEKHNILCSPTQSLVGWMDNTHRNQRHTHSFYVIGKYFYYVAYHRLCCTHFN